MRSSQRRRNNVLRYQLRFPGEELVTLCVVSSGNSHHHIELRKNQHVLTSIAGGVVITELPPAHFQAARVPGVAVSVICVRRDYRWKPRVPRDGILDPGLAQDAVSIPHSTGKIKLAELQLIARAHVEPSAHVSLAGGHEVHVVGSDL